MRYKIPVERSSTGTMVIEADSLEEAVEEANNAPPPDDTEYVDDSFRINYDCLLDYNEDDLTDKDKDFARGR
jgi:hypothetical protein